METGKYKKLFEPIKIGKLQLKNRFVKSASQTYFFDSGEHRISDLAKSFYGALAKGGAGLIIVETPAMEWPLKQTGDRRYRIDDDKYIKDIRQLTAAIHKYDCPTFAQLYHRGPWGGIYTLMAPAVAASSVTLSTIFDVHEEKPPKALTIAEIEEIAERFISAAVRAAKAGFDGVEVHAASDHLFHSFISRFWNKRTDKYGPQNMENRTRFSVDIVREIKKRVGQDFPVQVMMNAFEFGVGEEGLTIEEAKEIARIYQQAGADSLQVRTHWSGMHQGSFHHEVLFYPEPHIPFKEFPKEMEWRYKGPLVNVPTAAIIKKEVSIPIMTVGGFDADLGEMVLEQGKVDLIGMTRRFFADNEYPNKVREGRLDDIQPCTHCGNCNILYNEPRKCRINASFGTTQYEVKKAAKKKKVLVVGGGPAGLQAARIAAMRGHDVTLFEKGHYLGGSLPLAGLIKGFTIEDLNLIINFFKRQLKKLGVKVRLAKEFRPSDLDTEKPDVLVLAPGGLPTLPDIPGINGRNVIKSTDLYGILKFFIRFLGPKLLRFLTNFWMPLGKNVVIIGGAIHGCQLGEFLTKRGRKVTIVDDEKELGKWLAPERKTRLFYWFGNKGVELISGATFEEITPKGLRITTEDGKNRLLKADVILPAKPFAPNTELMDKLKGKVKEIYNIGDSANPAIIPDSTAAGWEIGNKI